MRNLSRVNYLGNSSRNRYTNVTESSVEMSNLDDKPKPQYWKINKPKH
jgi:hypothetical protein